MAPDVSYAWRLLVPTLVAALLTIAIVAPYALVYMRTERSVGARSVDEIRVYSASTASYLSAPAMNRLYGWTAVTDRRISAIPQPQPAPAARPATKFPIPQNKTGTSGKRNEAVELWRCA